ncbi:alpha/beta hydrolase [Flavobacterium algicola]|uniref:alpha/beta hydrolase n=1 Tax=Flavobacterium algicola TaxID=556529 RepID=UPI001EFD6B4E|nr:alpha/beta hydrolase [Flavobacterium algicola]MCG9793088.1 alpha/beta hydrolase [Flavobacterium algicola]
MTNLKVPFIILILLYSFKMSAQNNEIIYLWNTAVPDETEEKHPARQTDNVSGNVMRLTDVTNPTLTVFKPIKANNSKGGVIVCPGGGYSILAIDLEGYEIAKWLNELGYTAFVLEYRVPKKAQGAAQDIQRAIKMVRSRASDFNLDTEKIGLIGFSAGAHLSALATTNSKIDFYKKQDAIDDLSAKSNFTMLIYPAYLDKGENKTIDPAFTFDKQTPPFFIFGTSDDPYGNSGLVMGQAIRDNKTSVELHMYNSGGHGYGLRKGKKAAEIWPKLAADWLETIVFSKNKI